MLYTTYTAVRPQCCPVFGFPKVDFSNQTFRTLQNIYCSVISVVMFAFCANKLVFELCNMEITYISVIFLVLNTSLSVTMVYYRVKFIKDGNVVTNIFKNPHRVDKCLTPMGIKFATINHRASCLLYEILAEAYNALQLYVNLHDVLNHAHNLSTEFLSLFHVCV